MGEPTKAERRRKLFFSMLTLAAVVGVSVLLTSVATSYFRGQDPINQCVKDPYSQPFQITVRVEVIKNGSPIDVQGVGVSKDCVRPVHTLETNIIHVGYERPHPFTLGHFFYFWLGSEILNYDTTVYVNGTVYSGGDFRDIILHDGDIRIELTSKAG